jgi:hypothetical protein
MKKKLIILAIVLSAFIYMITWSPSTPIVVQPTRISQTYCYPSGTGCSMDDGCGYFFAWTACGNGGGGGNKKL